jgi:hypothetical protein
VVILYHRMRQTKKVYRKKRNNRKKPRSYKKYRGGTCNCKNLEQSGGGDYFLSGYKEPPSFDKVPISSFYPQNMYTAGTDVQGAQISSRGLPNMSSTGGGKKNKKNKTNKRTNRKMKGGMNFAYFAQDPVLGNNNDIISTNGNIGGALLSSNVLRGVAGSSYSSTTANINATPLV